VTGAPFKSAAWVNLQRSPRPLAVFGEGKKLEFRERWTKRAKEGRVRQEKRGTRKGREEEGGRRREGRGQTL